MHSSNINWSDGRVVFWKLDDVSDHKALSTQAHLLTEDLAQVTYVTGKLIDVGWYPDCSPDGTFTVLVVADDQWELPLLEERATDLAALESVLARAVAIASR